MTTSFSGIERKIYNMICRIRVLVQTELEKKNLTLNLQMFTISLNLGHKNIHVSLYNHRG